MWEAVQQAFHGSGTLLWPLTIVLALFLGMAFGGWIRGTGKEKTKINKSRGDRAFFKGVQYILSQDHDHAIEEFTKSVKLNSDTIETYVALGNLYRSKGDIERAIRIRQSIIFRPNIDDQIKVRAIFDLGLDYSKGGFLNRALKVFLEVEEQDPSNFENLFEMEKIYEKLRDWDNAYKTRQKIARLRKGEHDHILAHHLVEAGKVFEEKGDSTKAKSSFDRAAQTDKGCIDAYLHLGDLYFSKQDYKKAMAAWKKVVEVDPQFTFLAYRRLEGAYSKMRNLQPVEEFLKECAQLTSDPFTHLALARYRYNEGDMDGALSHLMEALELDPSFWEAKRLKGEILLKHGRDKDALVALQDIIEHLHVPYLKFQCNHCGFEPDDLQWQCPQCRNWDTIRLLESSKTETLSHSSPLQSQSHMPASERHPREA